MARGIGAARRSSRRWKHRGVSDVVGTILLLALTVTLFSSIFFFVSTFPSPSPQPVNQFSATLSYNSAGTQIVGVSILHLAGPAVAGSSLVYLYSAHIPGAFPTPFSVSSGLNNSQVWTLGQTWSKNISSSAITVPDNITISVVTTNQLLFRVTLPGPRPTAPPTFLQVGTSPSSPGVGSAFTVTARISDPTLRTNSVYANLSLIPGISGTGLFLMTYSASTGLWSYTVASGTTSLAGTYYIFLNATDQSGLRNSVAFTVTIAPASTSFSAVLTANNTAPMSSIPVLLTAYVTAGGSGASVTVAFTANGVALSPASGTVASGSTAAFTSTWTPAAAGVVLLQALVNSSGTVVAGATLNLTVFPPILFVSTNVPSGVRTANNESAFLAQELTSAGVPYTPMWVGCGGSLPSSATFNNYKVVIIDFGSTWVGGCPKAPSAANQGLITGASGPRFLLVGSFAFGVAACNSYTSAYFALVGAGYLAGSTCMTIPNATAAVTYSASTGVGFRGDGVPAAMTINATLGTSNKFIPYDYFSRAVTGTSFLKAGANVVGVFASGKSIALAADPALLTTTLPNANSWGTGQAGAAVVYNLVGYLAGLSSSTSSGRALTDYGIAQATILGLSHTRTTTFYVGVRENGPTGSAVTATLLVNGSIALYNGVAVYGTVTVSGAGGLNWITLVWVAPANGPFTLTIALTTGVGDLYRLNDQMPLSPLNQATSFT